MDDIAPLILENGFIIVLGDKDGNILKVKGDENIINFARK